MALGGICSILDRTTVEVSKHYQMCWSRTPSPLPPTPMETSCWLTQFSLSTIVSWKDCELGVLPGCEGFGSCRSEQVFFWGGGGGSYVSGSYWMVLRGCAGSLLRVFGGFKYSDHLLLHDPPSVLISKLLSMIYQ